MQINKKYYRGYEIADYLQIPRHYIDGWVKYFNIKKIPVINGTRRFLWYHHILFQRLNFLLNKEKYTKEGARMKLRDNKYWVLMKRENIIDLTDWTFKKYE